MSSFSKMEIELAFNGISLERALACVKACEGMDDPVYSIEKICQINEDLAVALQDAVNAGDDMARVMQELTDNHIDIMNHVKDLERG